MLTITYNIGHFYNTFTSSRAIVTYAQKNNDFYNLIINACEDVRYNNIAKIILERKDYHRVHLLNSILVLKKCNQKIPSVALALEILYLYLENLYENTSIQFITDEKVKFEYAFKLFNDVRKVSYISYDLQIAKTSLTIDISDDKAMLLLLKELLAEYNDNRPLNHLVQSTIKLLDDTLYNENSNAICYCNITKKIILNMAKKYEFSKNIDYYNNLFIDKNSALNKTYTHTKDYVQTQILKVTFLEKERVISEQILYNLQKLNNTRVGYYNRHFGEQTILISIKERCSINAKRKTAFKILKCLISNLRQITNISCRDTRFLLITKFFLFYLFNENPVEIIPTINDKTCVICTRGKNRRLKEIDVLLNSSIGTIDQKHEVEFLKKQLVNDLINDTTITIPASIILYKKGNPTKIINESEFDGLIIYPTRKSNQIIFLEAKNTNRNLSKAKKCLIEKLRKNNIDYADNDIKLDEHNVFFRCSIK